MSTKRHRVLFVDDEPSLLESVRIALRHEPFEVLTASSATEALELLERIRVDAVVSDEYMPGTSGSVFLGIVRREHPRVVRMMLTGKANLQAAIQAINDCEVYRFLTKPHSPDKLATVIREALKTKGSDPAVQDGATESEGGDDALSALEQRYPGIGAVERTGDGCIVIPDLEVDVEQLLQDLKTSAPSGDAN